MDSDSYQDRNSKQYSCLNVVMHAQFEYIFIFLYLRGVENTYPGNENREIVPKLCLNIKQL